MNKYPPPDDSWIRIGENAYKLPWENDRWRERKKLIWEKILKLNVNEIRKSEEFNNLHIDGLLIMKILEITYFLICER